MAKQRDLLIGLEMLTEGAAAAVPQSIRSESLSAESEKIKKRSRGWTMGAGIQGVGIGQKITGRRETDELVLKVYVERKKPVAKCKAPVPKRVRLPEVGSLPTDVEEIGRVEVESFTSRVRPSMPGCGVGHRKVTVGTFGCLVRKKSDAKGLYILSNSHVLANQGIAAIGDPILQPGVFDGGKHPADVIGRLSDFIPFQFSAAGYPNLVDAAIAKVKSRKQIVSQIRILGVKPVGVSLNVRRGMVVKKVGRTTDFTTGVVRDIHYRLALQYMKTPTVKARAGLRDQVLCTRYTAGGDSGSIVLNRANRAVGLHFAGSPSTSIFNKIEHVLTLLDVRLV